MSDMFQDETLDEITLLQSHTHPEEQTNEWGGSVEYAEGELQVIVYARIGADPTDGIRLASNTCQSLTQDWNGTIARWADWYLEHADDHDLEIDDVIEDMNTCGEITVCANEEPPRVLIQFDFPNAVVMIPVDSDGTFGDPELDQP
jgi:hypothetical protein